MTPDEITPVVGYRTWVPLNGGTRLQASSGDYRWIRGTNIATCHKMGRCEYGIERCPLHTRAAHDIANIDCTCGFYAYDTLGHLLNAFQPFNSFMNSIVYGQVEGFGRVTLCERGWRAEKARITGLYMIENCNSFSLIDWLAWQYRVPVLQRFRAAGGDSPDRTSPRYNPPRRYPTPTPPPPKPLPWPRHYVWNDTANELPDWTARPNEPVEITGTPELIEKIKAMFKWPRS